jgi:hypothetical protein
MSIQAFDDIYNKVLSKPDVSATKKRHFLPSEIELFLERLKRCMGVTKANIPVIISPVKQTQDSATVNLLQFCKEILTDIKIVPEAIKEYMDKVIENFLKAKIEAGSNAGAVAVEAFANPISQSNFNTFHLAGLSKNTSLGIEGFREIFELRKNRKRYSITIKYTENYSIDELLTTKMQELVSVYISNVIKDNEILNIETELFIDETGNRVIPKWFENSKKIFTEPKYEAFWNYINDAFRIEDNGTLSWCLELILDMEVMYRYNITPSDIVSAFDKKDGSYFIYSPVLKSEDGKYYIKMYVFPNTGIIMQIEYIKNLKIDSHQGQLMFLQNALIPGLSTYLIKGVPNIDKTYLLEVPLINVINNSFNIHRMVDYDTLINDFRDLYDINKEKLILVSYNKRYMELNGITEEDLFRLLNVIKIGSGGITKIPESENVISKYNLEKYDIILKVNNYDLEFYKEMKITEDDINLTDIIKYEIGKNKKIKDLYIESKRKERSSNKNRFIRLYPEPSNIDKYSVIRMIETDGVKLIDNVAQITKLGENKLLVNKSTLLKIFKLDDIDPYRTYCDDIYEMVEIFGIQAGRHVIAKLLYQLIKASDFVINNRHVLTFADYATRNGYLTGIGEKSLEMHDVGVTAQFSYQTPSKHIKNAALFARTDKLTNASALITVGRKINSGTSIVNIKSDPDKEKSLLKEIKSRKMKFDTSDTSNIIGQMLAIDINDVEEAITVIPMSITSAEEYVPLGISMENTPFNSDYNFMRLDPIVSDDIRKVRGTIGIDSNICVIDTPDESSVPGITESREKPKIEVVSLEQELPYKEESEKGTMIETKETLLKDINIQVVNYNPALDDLF